MLVSYPIGVLVQVPLKFNYVRTSFKLGAHQRPARTRFLEIAFVREVSVCMCVSALEGINNYSREMNL